MAGGCCCGFGFDDRVVVERMRRGEYTRPPHSTAASRCLIIAARNYCARVLFSFGVAVAVAELLMLMMNVVSVGGWRAG